MNRLREFLQKYNVEYLIYIFVIIIIMYIFYCSINPYLKAKETQNNLNAQLKQAQSENTDLKNTVTLTTGDGLREDEYYRERYHISEKGEIIFILPDTNE
ncbi:MAG: septum formation initiator family protein [Mycoplasmatales bacterium]